MRRTARLFAAVAVGYLAGTLPSADMASRLATHGRVELRDQGSGNPGGMNVANVIGPGWGAGVMVADAAKGLVACRVGVVLAGPAGGHVAGPAAVIGHCWPVWNGFRGGKGVATSVGQVLATFPVYFPVDALVAIVTVSSRRIEHRLFAANTAASIVWISAATLWWRKKLPNLWGSQPTVGLPLAAAVSSGVILERFLAAWQPGPSPTPSPQEQDSADDRSGHRLDLPDTP